MKKLFKTVIIAVMALSVCFGAAAFSEYNSETAYAVVYKQGSSGTTVKKIQQKLKNWGYYSGSVDGIYGAKTKAAVKYF